MNKFERALGLVDAILADLKNPDIHAPTSQLLELFDAEFPVPDDEHLKPTYDLLMNLDAIDWRAVPTAVPEAIWPILLMQVLLRDNHAPISPRILGESFRKFQMRYGKLIMDNTYTPPRSTTTRNGL